MVKGVSKTIIEVNNTGSKYFEKIVLYVTPQYGNLSAKQLKKAASAFSFNFDSSISQKPIKRVVNKRKIIILSSIGAIIFSTVGFLIAIL